MSLHILVRVRMRLRVTRVSLCVYVYVCVSVCVAELPVYLRLWTVWTVYCVLYCVHSALCSGPQCVNMYCTAYCGLCTVYCLLCTVCVAVCDLSQLSNLLVLVPLSRSV
jgi:hypothetical protein